jgi:Cu/Zn superoxide dismutase
MRTIPKFAALGAALVLGATVAPAVAGDTISQMAPMTMGKAPLTVPLKPENASGESGTATLTDTPAGLRVVISLKGAPAAAQPAHIHMGSCANLNPTPKYPLSNVVAGKSTTVVKGIKIAQLVGKTAINVHKSLTDIPTYVACGDIASSAMAPMKM